MRGFPDRFLCHFCPFQACRHRAANLLSLPPRPDQRRALCIHARENPNPPASRFARRANWTNLARISQFGFELAIAAVNFKWITSSSERSTPQRKQAFRTFRFRSLPRKPLQPSQEVLSKRATQCVHESGNRPAQQKESARDSTRNSPP